MKRFSNILLVVDERTDYSAALKRSAALARKNEARLTVCAVIDTVPGEVRIGALRITPHQVLDVATARKQEWLENTVDSVATDGVSIDKQGACRKTVYRDNPTGIAERPRPDHQMCRR